MTFGPTDSRSSYLPPEFDMPKDAEGLGKFVSNRERLTANILNIKTNGNYELRELLTADQWFSLQSNPLKPRYSFRTVVNFGALPNNTTGTAPHNIPVTQSTIFTRIYGVATNPNTKFIPLPYINTGTPGDSVELWADATNVNIKTTTGNYTVFTTVYVILEYIKS